MVLGLNGRNSEIGRLSGIESWGLRTRGWSHGKILQNSTFYFWVIPATRSCRNLKDDIYPKNLDPSKMPMLRTRMQVQTLPLEGPRILRVEHPVHGSEIRLTTPSPSMLLVPNMEVFAYISCMDTTYVRETPPTKQPYKIQYLHFRYLKCLVHLGWCA